MNTKLLWHCIVIKNKSTFGQYFPIMFSLVFKLFLYVLLINITQMAQLIPKGLSAHRQQILSCQLSELSLQFVI